MRITHTNRKGVTFYLGRGVTKTGKPRYFFAREPAKGEPVEAIPEGYEIVESINGVVSLAKARPALIRPEELALVEAAVAMPFSS
jgi:heptaprenylglyceryl phosphate synthase